MQVGTIVGGGVNNFTVMAAAGTFSPRRTAYRNDLIGNVNGDQEISAAFRFDSAVTAIQMGLIAMWDGISLDSLDKAYVMNIGNTPGSDLQITLRNGPSELGELITGPGAVLAVDTWYQVLFQMKFDAVGNLQLRVARSDPQVDDVSTPVYTLEFDEVVIPRQEARLGGKFGFYVISRQDNFETFIDHVAINTQLTPL